MVSIRQGSGIDRVFVLTSSFAFACTGKSTSRVHDGLIKGATVYDTMIEYTTLETGEISRGLRRWF